MSMSALVQVNLHDLPPELFDPLARVFSVSESGGARWITLMVDDVQLTMFAARPGEPEPEEHSLYA